ncbi:MAG: glycine cleavage system protein H [Zoogloeaceae bacterium]|nr:glycine cleavage system protein H [Zoogloeaceae bacterium]MCK6384310.1 glycine cleavage system protein H [Rhodocyclaceae bacterium]
MATEVYKGKVPADRLYDTRHDMWVRREGNEVVIGATGFGLHLAGEVLAFTAKPKGAEVAAGRGLGTVESAKTVLAVHSPVAFRLDTPNEAAEERPELINRDPYGAGWMARGAPLDWEADVAHLVDAAAYVAHIRAVEPAAVIEP